MLINPSLPQIACQMEEDALSPVSLCSAPTPSQPSPPPHSLPSVTPSHANNGTLADRRRSGRIQAIRSHTPEKQISESSRSPSPPSLSQSKRTWDGTNMVQVSQAKLPRVDDSHGHEARDQNGFEYDFVAERPEESRLQTLTGVDMCTTVGRVEPAPQLRLAMALDSGAAVAEQSISAPRSWVIGPLFQSFRSKMATFTEIVMSPVKLFRAPSPPPSPANCLEDAGGDQDRAGESSDHQSQLQRRQEEAAPAAAKCSKTLLFDNVEETDQADETPEGGWSQSAPKAVPLLVSTGSGSVEPSPVTCSVEEEPADAPLNLLQTRKCPRNRKKVPSKSLRPQSTSTESETCPGPCTSSASVDLSPPSNSSLLNHLTDADGGRHSSPQQGSEELQDRPHPAAAAAAGRSLTADCLSREPLKKKSRIEGEVRAPRLSRKKTASEEHVTRPAVKTRGDRKRRVEENVAAITETDGSGANPRPKSRAARSQAQRRLGSAMALETTIALTELQHLQQQMAVVLVEPLNVTDEKSRKRKSFPHESSLWAGEAAAPPQGARKKQKRAARPSQSGQRSLQPKEQVAQVRGQRSTDPLYFEMTPSHPLLPPDLPALVGIEDELLLDGAKRGALTRHVSGLRSQGVAVRHRRDSQPGRRRVQLGRVGHEGEAAEGGAHTAAARPVRSGLSRSRSCPEIPTLFATEDPHSASLPPPPRHRRALASPQQHAGHAHRSPRRARRHTVCSLEVEREIAPLCLRKEVYPSRRSLPSEGAGPSPSHSFSTLASSFLSSPLAFLSRKAVLPPAGPSPSLTSPSSKPSSHQSSTSARSLRRSEACSPALDRGVSLPCDVEEEEDDDTSSSSQEFEDVALREEKALSDSEVKVVQKLEERGKVSSIRIRKALPKPQNNLTPMGLPKAVRLKKKEFSLEEIYTNKNFNKPPESRLETIFEVPLKRRNGSESCFGQRRIKRFLEFLEVGEVRKPKKPLAGAGKAVLMAASSRTRRGGGSPRGEVTPHCAQDLDSVLCTKLDQLSLWLAHDGYGSEQMAC